LKFRFFPFKFRVNNLFLKGTKGFHGSATESPGEKYMSKFSIAFIVPSKNTPAVRHRIIEGETKDAALRQFFNEELKEFYSEDDQGFYYFKEDFSDDRVQSGSIIEL
jgi:hypothetical protein